MSVELDIAASRGRFDLEVELTLAPGEVLAVLGPNGAGKSTLLRALTGLSPIDRGRLAVDGTVLDDPADGVFVPPERRPIGVVFQDYLLFGHLSALENVAFGLRARGVPKQQARARAAALLARVGLDGLEQRRPDALSGGQAQRVALARALATEPRLLLLDEPLAALDAGTRGAIRRDLRRHLDAFGGMCVLVTHDPVDAHALADRIAVLDAGRLVQVGTIHDVTAHPRSRYVADLVGTNLVAGTVRDGVLTTAAGVEVVVSGAHAGPVFAVIRPHAIAVSRTSLRRSSVRNSWRGVVGEIDRLGDRARVGVEGPLSLTAEITVGSLRDLDLRPGDEIVASVKATDIDTYPA